MAWYREPSDPGNNWFHNPNPYNLQEPSDFSGGPGFLQLPTYSMIENTLRFSVRGWQKLTITIFWNGQPKLNIHHKQGDNNCYNLRSPLGYGNYHVKLIDAQGRNNTKPATFT